MCEFESTVGSLFVAVDDRVWFASGMAFFALAVISGTSLVVSYLFAIYGAAAGKLRESLFLFLFGSEHTILTQALCTWWPRQLTTRESKVSGFTIAFVHLCIFAFANMCILVCAFEHLNCVFEHLYCICAFEPLNLCMLRVVHVVYVMELLTCILFVMCRWSSPKPAISAGPTRLSSTPAVAMSHEHHWDF